MNKFDRDKLIQEVQKWKNLATQLISDNLTNAEQQEIIQQFEESIDRFEKTLITSRRKRRIPMADLATGLMQLDRRRR